MLSDHRGQKAFIGQTPGRDGWRAGRLDPSNEGADHWVSFQILGLASDATRADAVDALRGAGYLVVRPS